jgi:hypothetical protein
MTDPGVSAPLAARAALNDGGKGSWIAGEDPFVVALRPVLAAAGKAARISYAGLCQTDDANSLRIPQDKPIQTAFLPGKPFISRLEAGANVTYDDNRCLQRDREACMEVEDLAQ